MSDEIEKLKMHSPDLTQDNIAKIRALFPGCVTEAAGEDGKLRLAVDFDQLKQELSDSIVEGPQERYHLNWPGKREALITANAPIAKTLRPARDESVDFDTTQNLFIEGDNLEALQLLQKNYLGSVKCIYIDPPYNTGGDFVYKDNFKETAAEFMETAGQKDELGNRLVANKESNGRFHSDWLSMMYTRLKVAQRLLAPDGFIFLSIDNNEVHNLKSVCSEVFGHENFRNMIVVRRGVKNVQSQFEDISDLASGHEYILCYSRSPDTRMPKLQHISEEAQAGKWDTFWRGTDRHTMRYDLFGQTPETGQWRWSKDKAATAAKNYNEYLEAPEPKPSLDDHYLHQLQATNVKLDFVRLNDDGVVQYYVPPRDYKLMSDNWMDITLKGNYIGFDTEKHVGMMRRIVDWLGVEDGIFLDFFAGSGSTGHAVIQSNAQLGRNSRYILVQLPVVAEDRDYETISSLTKERLRKAGSEVREAFPETSTDVGFRVLKIDSSNMADVFYTPDQTSQADLLSRVDNVKPDRTVEDLLFQVLLDWGVDLTLPIRRETVQGKTVFFVDDTALMACFDDGISEDLVKELAGHSPMRIVFKDTGFADDQTKINVRQIFKAMSPDTDVKAI
ncbi:MULTISPECIES: site-specific DNA-methyltransferase [unclassified Phaeobacter]|uniref:site-specific DNA-methyltransferase n=1 Tax=unclassified Phaeobacter TaxID=2621772 RepID=UPI003A8A6810